MEVSEQAFGPDEAPTAPHDPTNLSGVHEAATQPAPYVEDLDSSASAVGSIPTDALRVSLAPIVELETGLSVAYHLQAGSTAVGLETAEDLYARAGMEHRVGELGRAIRARALEPASDQPLFLPTRPAELKDGWLVRPDDPVAGHDGELFLELEQPELAPIGRQVLNELTARPGVGICLAGFGTAASSLELLVELAPTYVKVSERMLTGVPDDQRRTRALHRLVQLCQDLGATPIASGIQNDRQRRAVGRCGVRLGEGPLFDGLRRSDPRS